MSIKPSEPCKCLDVRDIPGFWPGKNSVHLNRVHRELVVLNDHFKELNLGLFKGTFCCFEVKVVLVEDSKNFPDYLMVVL
jgi:hypothetical protein